MNDAAQKTEADRQATATAGPAAMAVALATAPTKAAQDQNHGRGGIYTVTNGVRKRVGGTAQTSVKKD